MRKEQMKMAVEEMITIETRNPAQENLAERLDRKETVRGTALTIMGGFLWGIA